jgi:hypothetical protein
MGPFFSVSPGRVPSHFMAGDYAKGLEGVRLSSTYRPLACARFSAAMLGQTEAWS